MRRTIPFLVITTLFASVTFVDAQCGGRKGIFGRIQDRRAARFSGASACAPAADSACSQSTVMETVTTQTVSTIGASKTKVVSPPITLDMLAERVARLADDLAELRSRLAELERK